MVDTLIKKKKKKPRQNDVCCTKTRLQSDWFWVRPQRFISVYWETKSCLQVPRLLMSISEEELKIVHDIQVQRHWIFEIFHSFLWGIYLPWDKWDILESNSFLLCFPSSIRGGELLPMDRQKQIHAKIIVQTAPLLFSNFTLLLSNCHVLCCMSLISGIYDLTLNQTLTLSKSMLLINTAQYLFV